MSKEHGSLSSSKLLLATALAAAPFVDASAQAAPSANVQPAASYAGAYGDSGGIPVGPALPFTSFSPLVLKMPGRPLPLEIKVSVPATGTNLPVILLSHGHGATNFLSSLRGYGPLADFWAAHGFVVIQPTHLDSRVLGLRETQLEDAPTFWRSRATDMTFIIDHLTNIEETVPGLKGRIDRSKISAVGHSLGGATVSALMGMQVLDPEDHREKDVSDNRIKAGVVIGAPGLGRHLNAAGLQRPRNLQFFDFSKMSGTTLVVAGDKDINPGFSDLVSYRSDAYTYSPPGNKTLLTMFGGEHIFGGISGYDAVETTDENTQRVAALRALIWAYVRSQLYPGDPAWANASKALSASKVPVGKIETR